MRKDWWAVEVYRMLRSWCWSGSGWWRHRVAHHHRDQYIVLCVVRFSVMWDSTAAVFLCQLLQLTQYWVFITSNPCAPLQVAACSCSLCSNSPKKEVQLTNRRITIRGGSFLDCLAICVTGWTLSYHLRASWISVLSISEGNQRRKSYVPKVER
jgi:hypothetical protein